MRKLSDLIKENESAQIFDVTITLTVNGEITAASDNDARERVDEIIGNTNLSCREFSIENWVIDNITEVDNSVQENIDNGLSTEQPEVDTLNKIVEFIKEVTANLTIGQKQYVAQNLYNSTEFLMNSGVQQVKSEYPSMLEEEPKEETEQPVGVEEVQPVIDDESAENVQLVDETEETEDMKTVNGEEITPTE